MRVITHHTLRHLFCDLSSVCNMCLFTCLFVYVFIGRKLIKRPSTEAAVLRQ